jgi:cytochrome c oxidase subunit II
VLADTRQQFLDLFSVYEWLLVAVMVVYASAIVFAVVHWRRRRDERPQGKDEHKLGESIYAVVLACIAAALITLTFRTEARVDPLSAAPKVRIDITAFQWQWRFDYPGTGRTVIGGPNTYPVLVVPAHEVVQFRATSTDVIHSFWVPDERFKRDAFPYRTTRFDLVFDRLGTHPGHCAEFCGLRHADMNFRVRVVPPDQFRAWLKQERRA